MAAVTELGTALRALVDASVSTAVGPEELRAAAAEARRATALLEADRRPPGRLPPLDDPVAFRRVYSPVTGVGSAVAPPLTLRGDPAGGVRAEATLGLLYEGPPGYLHGGMSGLLMDHLLGAAAIHAGLWGMTAHLELDYRGPVPLGVPLVLRGWVERNAGRRTDVAGSIAAADAPDRVLVQATGIFVTPRAEKMDAYFATVTDAAGRHTPPGRPTDATAVQP
ncbi:PaaI family thioesterase [Modestobacter sp. I12A-02628]|uniref:Acyl-coenzyme A thioesterase THEM4 n=2 Tax=Goekera deserti TaxID=2497753 RepID=A0A7K3W8X7_9ACTN|nr:PaaI family thioesterase [Goekera deserti]NDI49187.1 PaaI family thioesterase [Goekera deserti]NEL52925.1 PaaI family thioesterase [Goekera deserti]